MTLFEYFTTLLSFYSQQYWGTLFQSFVYQWILLSGMPSCLATHLGWSLHLCCGPLSFSFYALPLNLLLNLSIFQDTVNPRQDAIHKIFACTTALPEMLHSTFLSSPCVHSLHIYKFNSIHYLQEVLSSLTENFLNYTLLKHKFLCENKLFTSYLLNN